MKQQLKAILFDHDGTLVDSEHVHYLHWRRIVERYSADFPLNDYIKGYTGVPTHQNALDLISKYQLNVTPEYLVSEKNKLSEKSLIEKEYQLMAYALETVKYFEEKKIKMCVVSGSNHDEVVQSIANQNMSDFFEFIVGGDDVNKSKPAPDVYLKAMRDLNLKPGECIAVEDTASGINAAKTAGLTCIAVKSKYSESQDFSKADILFTNLRDAKNWILDNYIF